MSTFTRFIASGPGALVITVSLGLVMANMIKVSFTPEAKTDMAKFEINPVAEDIAPPGRDTGQPELKKVEIPPAPPTLDHDIADIPLVPIATLDGSIPNMLPITFERDVFTVKVSDRDAQPLVRIAPIMPPRAEKSGHCKVRFDVSPDGQPYNVAAHYCSQNLFERATIKSVQRWKYQPKIQNGLPVARSGVEATITFRLLDENERVIPE